MSSFSDFLIVLDYGYSKDKTKRTSIYDLGDYVLDYCRNHPGTIVLAQGETYDYMRDVHVYHTKNLRKINVGQSSTDGTTDGGSYHVLCEAAKMLQRDYAERLADAEIMVVAHRLHVKRVVQQGKLFGLELIVPPNLPRKLYRSASQWWCRNRWLWYLRELIGYPILKLKGQL